MMAEKKARRESGVKKWQKELEAAKKRTRKFRERGQLVVKRFLDERETTTSDIKRLNLFHNHVSTLQSMLYGKLPRAEVARRYADSNDDVARVGSLVLNRLLNNDIQNNGSGYSDLLRSCLQDRLLPGLGVARVYYDLETEEREVEAELDPETGEEISAAFTDTQILWEEAELGYVHWQDFLWGYGRCWEEVPWVAFRSYMDREKAEKRFGDDVAKKLRYSKQNASTDEDSSTIDDEYKNPNEEAEVWEIWDKKTQKVYWYSEGYDSLCDEQEDPLELRGFFPCPTPMMANVTTSIFVPKSDFTIAQDLYNEIDRLEDRISVLTRALKVVGVYDKNNDATIGRMLADGNDNKLIPVDNWAMFAEKGGIKGVVDWFPLDQVSNTLGNLRELRTETIALLYQVTGLSDILRGGATPGGQPSSATEQALKAKFASVRVQYLQDEFARFASELLALRAEVIGRHFDPESIVEQSNIQFGYDEEQLVMEGIKLIKDPEKALWRIEVKPESIAMVDYAQLKAERTEYLASLSTFLQSAQSVVKIEPGMGPVLLELMKWGLAGFKGSQEIEGVVDRAIDEFKKKQQQAESQPPPPDPEVQKEQMKFQNEMKKIQAKAMADLQKIAAKAQADMQNTEMQGQYDLMQEELQNYFKMVETEVQSAADLALARIQQQNKRKEND